MEINVNDENFSKEVLRAELPVLVDFWAEWCGPCRMMGPVVADIAKKYTGKLKVCKLNIDEANLIAVQYQVMSIPTLTVFQNGKPAAQAVGALPKAELEEFIKPFIKS